MAINGTFRANQSGPVPYTGAGRWGHGWNPVHAINDRSGRNLAPDGIAGSIPADIETKENYGDDDDCFAGYTQEDSASILWGAGSETGTSDRPSLDQSDSGFRAATMRNYPSPGRKRAGVPGGGSIRSIDKGAEQAYTTRSNLPDSAAAGWENKLTGDESISVTSDDSQYTMQTSMTQLHKTREGSQRGDVSNSPYTAPIKSRVPGMQVLKYAGGYRHYAMEPKAQDFHVRPFWTRTAGVGPVRWMEPNDMYVSDPLNRVSPDEPYPGPDVTGSNQFWARDNMMMGYTEEDVVY